MDVELHVADVIHAAGHATKGTNLFTGPVVDKKGIPDDVVFILLYAGEVTPFMDGPNGADLHEDRIQIRVRHRRYDDGLALAKNLHNVVHKQDPPEHGYAGWLASKPMYMGFDTHKERHNWSVNLTATYKE